MLPFGRMLEYGNIRPNAPAVKKILTDNKLEMVLIDDGSLYAHGQDDSYNWGGSTKLNASGMLQLSSTGVDDFWLGVCIIVRKGTTMLLSGSSYAFSGSNVTNQGFTDFSSFFSTIDVANIKKMICGYTLFILMNDGTLYGRGFNRSGTVGLGHKNYVPDWVQMGTDVAGIYGDNLGDTLIVVKNDGTVWGSGANNSLQIRTPVGDVTTLVPMFNGTAFDINFVLYYSGVMLCTTDNKIYCTGTTLSGSGNHSKIYTINFNVGPMNKIYPAINTNQLGSRVFLYSTDINKLMVSGYRNMNGTSDTDYLPILDNFVEFNFGYSTDMYLAGGGYFNTFYDSTNVWMGGYPPSMMAGLNTAMCSIPMKAEVTLQIDLPWKE